MAPVGSLDKKKKSWSEINKTRKEERKKWKEQSLIKKIEKQKLKEVSESSNKEADAENLEPETEINEDLTEPPTNPCQNQPDITSNLNSTLSIAVPGSILENAQSQELRTYLAGQIARAACIFCVDEIVVFDDYGDEANAKKSTLEDTTGTISARQSCVQLGRILQYLECPQYLRKSFFPIHKDLKFCGILNPLNTPHHLGPYDEFPFREGVVMNKPSKQSQGSFVNVGLLREVHVDKLLTPSLRCTVKLLPQNDGSKKLKGIVVPPSAPKKETGVYWGYSVRIANSFSKVFSQSPYKEGYDLTVGTSDKGTSIDDFICPSFKHILIVFGGLNGLESALENDPILNVDDPELLFDKYLNTLPGQGSKTIRTEEAILVSLAALRPKLNLQSKYSLQNEPTNVKVKEKSVVQDNLSQFD